ncbi:hypothetical protein [Defluviimonas sp. SAOS-178_SWC]|uniref:hypothetical protein n=1 Tax=Defluviimonas sp. SAOS-178_SWC TaxID=3121287 RepID=UPI003221597D
MLYRAAVSLTSVGFHKTIRPIPLNSCTVFRDSLTFDSFWCILFSESQAKIQAHMLEVSTRDIIESTGLTPPSVSQKMAGIPCRRDGPKKIFNLVLVLPLMSSPRLRRAVPDLIATASNDGDPYYVGPAAEAVRNGKALHRWMDERAKDRMADIRTRFGEGLGRAFPAGGFSGFLDALQWQLVCNPTVYRAAILNDFREMPEDWADFAAAFSIANATHIYNEVV